MSPGEAHDPPRRKNFPWVDDPFCRPRPGRGRRLLLVSAVLTAAGLAGLPGKLRLLDRPLFRSGPVCGRLTLPTPGGGARSSGWPRGWGSFSRFLPSLLGPLLRQGRNLPWIKEPIPEKAAWLNAGFLFAGRRRAPPLDRSLYGLISYSVKRTGNSSGGRRKRGPEEGKRWRAQRVLSPVFGILYAFILTSWPSTSSCPGPPLVQHPFGAYYFMSSFYAALAALVLLSTFCESPRGFRIHPSPSSPRPGKAALASASSPAIFLCPVPGHLVRQSPRGDQVHHPAGPLHPLGTAGVDGPGDDSGLPFSGPPEEEMEDEPGGHDPGQLVVLGECGWSGSSRSRRLSGRRRVFPGSPEILITAVFSGHGS